MKEQTLSSTYDITSSVELSNTLHRPELHAIKFKMTDLLHSELKSNADMQRLRG